MKGLHEIDIFINGEKIVQENLYECSNLVDTACGNCTQQYVHIGPMENELQYGKFTIDELAITERNFDLDETSQIDGWHSIPFLEGRRGQYLKKSKYFYAKSHFSIFATSRCFEKKLLSFGSYNFILNHFSDKQYHCMVKCQNYSFSSRSIPFTHEGTFQTAPWNCRFPNSILLKEKTQDKKVLCNFN